MTRFHTYARPHCGPEHPLHPHLSFDFGSVLHLTPERRFINLYGGDAVFATEDANIEDPLPAEDRSWSQNVSPASPLCENIIVTPINFTDHVEVGFDGYRQGKPVYPCRLQSRSVCARMPGLTSCWARCSTRL